MDEDNLQKQILAMGYPSAKIMLYELAKYYNRTDLFSEIENIFSISENGCLKIEYNNITNNKKEYIIIYMKECDKDHDLSIQMDKLKLYINQDKWNEVLKSLSMLILLIRSIYTTVYENNIDLICNIVGVDNLPIFSKLHVDLSNTTLYLPMISTRLGIFFEKIENI
jgi:hypothetical protein